MQPWLELSEGQSDGGGRRRACGGDLQYTPKCHPILILSVVSSSFVLPRHATVTFKGGEKRIEGSDRRTGCEEGDDFFTFIANVQLIKLTFT